MSGCEREKPSSATASRSVKVSCSRSQDCWDRWKDPSGSWVKTCSILTTTPNAVTAPVHDRMPVVLHPDGYDLWLDPGMQNVAAASDLLKPYDARVMRCYPVSTRINSVANDDEECSAPVEPVVAQDRLFS
jgi:putative SOS response-associated peptidase YedK